MKFCKAHMASLYMWTHVSKQINQIEQKLINIMIIANDRCFK